MGNAFGGAEKDSGKGKKFKQSPRKQVFRGLFASMDRSAAERPDAKLGFEDKQSLLGSK